MNDPIAKRLFRNAIGSVELGLEDFRLAKSDPRRYVSATRNVFAGMLLLFKSWLAEESAERNYDLLRAETKEVKKLPPEEWADISEAKTAGFDEIKDRIGAKVDWVRIDKLHEKDGSSNLRLGRSISRLAGKTSIRLRRRRRRISCISSPRIMAFPMATSVLPPDSSFISSRATSSCSARTGRSVSPITRSSR